MQDLNDLLYFVKVVEAGGFAPAERAIGVAKSKLSRRIAGLEERLGVRLLHRSTRRFSVTDIGQRYYEHCRAMLIEAEAAQEAVDQVRGEPCGTIRVTCPVGLLNFHVGEMVGEFLNRYPRVSMELEATNRRVDLMAEGVDVALRVRPLPLENSDLVLRVLSDRGQCLVASPGLVERMGGEPKTPESLSQWPAMTRSQSLADQVWVLNHTDGERKDIAYSPRYATTDMEALKKAALAGAGVVQLPLLMLGDELANGALVWLLPDWEPRREVIHLVFPSRRGMLPAVRAFIDFLAECYAQIQEN
ncbi:DNA-binding transcriptional regulator, LysR family [Marinobacter gudaonensis]|uniref:DNA-binding transcriptional regulator, LysR family n=1 Tax=Marinobacter gudaonensis TaxID=375760 RepID=A0A1I6GP07_9GAMM|nr:LysR family transcriptional regulator [Marinobacter gudaonensis]SFR43898.1 DNA-binding transcriptional regulator, LysR family [Marinobacter gudaonensis]